MMRDMQACRSFNVVAPVSVPAVRRTWRPARHNTIVLARRPDQEAFPEFQRRLFKFAKQAKQAGPWGLDLTSEQSYLLRNSIKEVMEAVDASQKGTMHGKADEQNEEPHHVPADIEETHDGYHLFIDAPGIDKSSAKISLKPEARVMIVTWRRDRHMHSDPGPQKVYRGKYERLTGEFKRVVPLARHCDPSTIKAQLKNGVLHISAKKRLPARDVEITSN